MGSSRRAFALLFVILFVTSLVLLPPAQVKAQPKILVVPDDYSTINAAIDSAANGDIIQVKAGAYEENAINTNKSLSIIGEGSQDTIINLNSPSHDEAIDVLGDKITFYDPALTVNSDNFTISGLTINSNGGSISLNGNRIQISSNKITAFFVDSGNYQYVSNNSFSDGSGISGNFS